MLPLFGLSVLLYSQAFQLLLYLYTSNLGKRNDKLWREWVTDPSKGTGRVGEIIRYTQENVRTAKQLNNRFEEVHMSLVRMLDLRIAFLNTLVAAAPLMGLLGTVLGMLATFFGLANSAGGDSVDVVASGISEALLTTATGLFIALPGFFCLSFIKRKKHIFESSLAQLETLTLTFRKLG